MTKKKLSSTNLEQGKNRQDHWWKTVNFCPKCYAHGSRPHYPNCDGVWVQISQDAQIPKRTSSPKVWGWFIRKFVDCEFKKEKLLRLNKKSKIIWKKKIT